MLVTAIHPDEGRLTRPKYRWETKNILFYSSLVVLYIYHASDNIDEIEQDSSYRHSVLEKLNKRDRQGHYRPSREPYLNSYVAKLRQDIRERLAYNHRFQRDNLNKRERVALKRLSNNKDIIIKLADKGGPTVILNTGNYITEAMLQLNNEEYYKRVEEDLTSQHEQLINQFISDW